MHPERHYLPIIVEQGTLFGFLKLIAKAPLNDFLPKHGHMMRGGNVSVIMDGKPCIVHAENIVDVSFKPGRPVLVGCCAPDLTNKNDALNGIRRRSWLAFSGLPQSRSST